MKIFIIFKKELKEALRDKKSIRSMILIPLLIFPVLFLLMGQIFKFVEGNIKEKTYYVGIYTNEQNIDFIQNITSFKHENYKIIYQPYNDSNQLIKNVKEDSIQIAILDEINFVEKLNAKIPVNVKLYYNYATEGIPTIAEQLINHINQQYVQKRYEQLNIKTHEVTPLTFSQINSADDRETFGKMIGGYIPYIFILMAFSGCVNLSIDLFTGEKERGTLETILTTPINKIQILIGKILVIIIGGIISLTANFMGILIAYMLFAQDLDQEMKNVINSLITPNFVIMVYILLIPLIAIFAGLLVSITIRAQTFKEAQAKIAPINMLIIFPAMIGTIPGVELNLQTVFIPIINIVLTFKEITANTLDLKMAGLAIVSTLLYASIAILLSYKSFDKESNLLK